VTTPIRTGVIGVGYLGRFHADKYAEMDDVALVGVVDTDQTAVEAVSKKLSVPFFTDYKALIGKVDAVSVVVPTHLHYQIARDFLINGVDVLVEKPMTTTIEEADGLIALAREHHRILQVGHLERFNAAFLAIEGVLEKPLFIESHRLAPFKDRSMDVDVILDIMIHDIDIILNATRSPASSIHAVGIPVISKEKNDIANVRIEFESGCVANLTASRISAKEMRKIRIFQANSYLSIDFAAQAVEVYRKQPTQDPGGMPEITYEKIDIGPGDSLKKEIEAFLRSVRHRTAPEVPGQAGRNALKVALEIVDQVESKKKELAIDTGFPGL
jgi:predicted dehydrogenase